MPGVFRKNERFHYAHSPTFEFTVTIGEEGGKHEARPSVRKPVTRVNGGFPTALKSTRNTAQERHPQGQFCSPRRVGWE